MKMLERPTYDPVILQLLNVVSDVEMPKFVRDFLQKEDVGSYLPLQRVYTLVSREHKCLYSWDTEVTALRMHCLQCMLYKNLVGNVALKKDLLGVIRGFLSQRIHARPLSLMFAGTTGSGKTATAEWIAKALFPILPDYTMDNIRRHYEKVAGMETPRADTDRILIIDMGGSSTEQIIGHPPGYSTSHIAGILPPFVSRGPVGVVLFDEVEKATAETRQILLSIMDQGRLTDGKGNQFDMRDYIVILTTNAGVKGVIRDNGICAYRANQPVDDPSYVSGTSVGLKRASPLIESDYAAAAARTAIPDEDYNIPERSCRPPASQRPVSPEQRRYGQFLQERVEFAMGETFPPEFRNRLKIFFFWSCYTLGEAHALVEQELRGVEQRLVDQRILAKWKIGERDRFVSAIVRDFQREVMRQGVRGLKEFMSKVEGYIIDIANRARSVRNIPVRRPVALKTCGLWRGDQTAPRSGKMSDPRILCPPTVLTLGEEMFEIVPVAPSRRQRVEDHIRKELFTLYGAGVDEDEDESPYDASDMSDHDEPPSPSTPSQEIHEAPIRTVRRRGTETGNERGKRRKLVHEE